jgi:hypothetical protein
VKKDEGETKKAEGMPVPPARVVPRGLRSFGGQDADFFLDLLPGPRDRDGLPDALTFWKARLESVDPDGALLAMDFTVAHPLLSIDDLNPLLSVECRVDHFGACVGLVVPNHGS